MNKPHIWRHGGTWLCGKQRTFASGIRTHFPVAPLFGTGYSPKVAYDDWLKVVAPLMEKRRQPFKVGDIVRQGRVEAVVTCAHENGGLDVRCTKTGDTWGWDARFCNLVRHGKPDDFFVVPLPEKTRPWWWPW